MSHEPGDDEQGGHRPSKISGSRHDDDSPQAAEDIDSGAGSQVEYPDTASLGADRYVDSSLDEGDSEVVEPEVLHAVERAATKAVRRTLSFKGPIPPAGELKAYDEVLPGAAERILRMAEKALDSQIEVDTTLAHGDVGAVKRGQLLSTAVVMLGMVAAFVTAMLGAPWEVVTIFLLPGIFEFGTSLVRAVREPTKGKGSDDD